jgi:cytochrome bd-type quinol oxidase subunit 2
MPTGPEIILTLKVLVVAVTLLLAAAIAALAAGRPRLHGRINTVFFVLTMLTVVGFEVLLQFVDVKSTFDDAARRALRTHLWFAVPSAVVLPVMFVSGRTKRKRLHVAFAAVFVVLWAGTFVTGVFFLPH